MSNLQRTELIKKNVSNSVRGTAWARSVLGKKLKMSSIGNGIEYANPGVG
jgi:hypothetical protein